jgi:hypothetical protein
MFKTNYFKELADKWPSTIVARDQIYSFTGGAITQGRMANLDCLGDGPPRFRCGRKVCYRVQDLLTWLDDRTDAIAEKSNNS